MPVAGYTTIQIGSYSFINDSFSATLDLNDRNTYYLDTITVQPFQRTLVSSFNVRVPGEPVYREQKKNRAIEITLAVKAATTSALDTALSNLLQAVEGNLPGTPYYLQLKRPSGTTTKYSTVLNVEHDVPASAREYLAGVAGGKTRLKITFHVAPYAWGSRVWLANQACNPGFEQPNGPGVTVFSDTFANLNAYAVQAGGALGQDKSYYPDTVGSLNGAAGTGGNLTLLRYFRLDESSGTTAYDASGNAQNGTTHGTPTQGVASLLTGDTDTCYTFASASSQYISQPGTGLPSGNANVSFGCWFKIAANPAAIAMLICLGNQAVAKNAIQLYVNTSGDVVTDAAQATGTVTSGAVTTGTPHHAVATWDGTNLKLYVDGSLIGTGNPGSLSIPATPNCNIGANNSPSLYFNGQIDEPFVFSGCLTSSQVTALYNAGHNTPSAASNTLLIPAAGRVSFGSPAWGALNTWQVRFRFLSAATSYTFYLHYTDANNSLRCWINGAGINLVQMVGGVDHTIGTQGATLVNGVQYWLVMSQFPVAAAGQPFPWLSAQVFYDNAGALSTTAVASAVAALAQDYQTALVGAPQIAASGAALGLGGNFSNVHTVSLFGPGGWTFTRSQNGATGQVLGAWDGTRAEFGMSGNATAGTQTYGAGPVTSFGAARLDLPPAGTVDALLQLYTGGAPAGTYAIPVKTATNVLGYSVEVKETGLNSTSGHATIAVVITEYNASGTSLRSSGNLGALTGGTLPTTWTQISGTYTTGANCAYVDLAVRVVDTTVSGESANATVWVDNVLVWDVTRTGVSSGNMPYCELCFPQSPAQLLVSGLVGDVAVPAFLALATYESSFAPSSSLTLEVGRRARATAGMTFIFPSEPTSAATLDSTAYGGFYASATGGSVTSLSRLVANSDVPGVYRVIARAYTTQVSTYWSSVGILLAASEQLGTTLNVASLDVSRLTTNGGFTASSVWTPYDAGQLTLPLTPRGALTDSTTTSTNVATVLTDASGHAGGIIYRLNWNLLLPADGNVLTATLYNGSNNSTTYTTSYLYTYMDPLAPGTPAWTCSVESAAIPNPASGVGSVGSASSYGVAVNPAADASLTLDPTQKISGTGVNQLGAFLTDASGTVLPLFAELAYYPQYLYPL